MESPIEQYRGSEQINFKYAVGDIGIISKSFHEHYEVFLLLNGDVEYIGETMRCAIHANDLLLIPPGVYHQFLVTGDKAEYARYVLEIQQTFPSMEHFQKILTEQKLFSLEQHSPVIGAFARLKEYSGDLYASDYRFLAESVAVEILALLRQQEPNVKAEHGILDKISCMAMKYIHSHLNSPLSLQEIADACFVSPSNLSHSFRKSYGISTMQYIRNKKMTTANLLLMSGMAPGEVALRCGYIEYSTFYRTYVREYGHSPTLSLQKSNYTSESKTST